mgnify:CR=1 FL=1
MNNIYITGNAGKDAEDRVTKLGTRVVSLSICEDYKKKDGSDPLWMRITAFQTTAPGSRFVCDNLASVKKGASVMVCGRVDGVSSYIDKNGNAKAILEIIATEVKQLAKRDDTGQQYSAPQQQQPQKPQKSADTDTAWDDGIPF